MSHSIVFTRNGWTVVTSLGALELSWVTVATYGEALDIWTDLGGA